VLLILDSLLLTNWLRCKGVLAVGKKELKRVERFNCRKDAPLKGRREGPKDREATPESEVGGIGTKTSSDPTRDAATAPRQSIVQESERLKDSLLPVDEGAGSGLCTNEGGEYQNKDKVGGASCQVS